MLSPDVLYIAHRDRASSAKSTYVDIAASASAASSPAIRPKCVGFTFVVTTSVCRGSDNTYD